jgi:hypothetical protein
LNFPEPHAYKSARLINKLLSHAEGRSRQATGSLANRSFGTLSQTPRALTIKSNPSLILAVIVSACSPLAARADFVLDAAKNLLVAQEAAVFIPARLAFFAGADSSSAIIATGTYSTTGWTLNEVGVFQGQVLSVSMQGSFQAATNTMTFSANGSYGANVWLTTGLASFSGANSELLTYQENGQIGSPSWHWWALGGEIIAGVAAGIIGTPATGLAVGGVLLAASGVAIAIDVAHNPAKPTDPTHPPPPATYPVPPGYPPPGSNGMEMTTIVNQTPGSTIHITKDLHAPQSMNDQPFKPDSRYLTTGEGSSVAADSSSGTFTDIFHVQAVPEPSSLALTGLGLLLIWGISRSRRRR